MKKKREYTKMGELLSSTEYDGSVLRTERGEVDELGKGYDQQRALTADTWQ